MFAHNAVVAPAAIALTVACQLPAPEIGPLSEEDVAAIKSLGAALDEAALASDWGALAALLTEDAVFMPPNA